jgi:hypothetical protein
MSETAFPMASFLLSWKRTILYEHTFEVKQEQAFALWLSEA